VSVGIKAEAEERGFAFLFGIGHAANVKAASGRVKNGTDVFKIGNDTSGGVAPGSKRSKLIFGQ